jgi:excisionase family DNA binding protein
MTVPEVANYFGTTERMVNRMIADGRLTAVYVGKLKRVHVDDANAFIAANRRQAGQ